jgi:predicted O-methyltransferase YrrM
MCCSPPFLCLTPRQVADPERVKKESTPRIVDEFNSHVARDPRVHCVILPFADGITLAYKNPQPKSKL